MYASANTNGNAIRRRRLLVVDAHPIVCEGLRAVFDREEDLHVVGQAGSTREARALIKTLLPELVLTSINLKQDDGVELLRDVRAHYPRLPVLVVAEHDEMIYAQRVLAAGANGYVMKGVSIAELLTAVRRVLSGGVFVSDAVSASMLKKFVEGSGVRVEDPISGLSTRELQVLDLLGRGLSTREIAKAHNLSVKTVESHRQRIKNKLKLANSSQLVQYAVSWSMHHNTPALLPTLHD